MKTPLPEKINPPTMIVSGSDLVTVCPLNQEAQKINEIITYLQSLEEELIGEVLSK